MPIYTGIQRRNYRVGQIKAGDKDEKGRPHRLDGFRFVTPARSAADEVATYFEGNDPRPFGRQWEVYTKVREIAVALPPGSLVISQSMMRWSGGGPTMVCDGISTSQPGRGPCQCPQPADPDDEVSVWEAIEERRKLAAQKTPRGCYPYTWINVCLPDIGGLGVWQLLSKSENAAAEIIQQAAMLEQARAAGQYLPARLALEYREARVGGMLRQYNVPAIRIDASIRAIANGNFAGRPLTDQLPPAPGEQRRAITAGAAARPGQASQDPPPLNAQQIADAIAVADSREAVERWMTVAKESRIEDDHIRVPDLETEVYEPLAEFAGGKWKSLPAQAGAA